MTMQYIPLSALEPSATNVRKTFRQSSIEELAQCILTDSLLQNLVVHGLKSDGSGYTIISGERRYRALKLLVERGQLEANALIPVEIRDGLSAQDSHRLATVENVQRENLLPLEEAEAVAGLIQNGQTLADVSAQTGLSVHTIKRRLALVNLTDAVKDALSGGDITLGQAEALTLGSPEEQQRILERLINGYHKETSVGLPALAGRGKELTSEGSMPDGVTIIYKLDEPSMGESSFKGRLPPLGGSPVTTIRTTSGI